VVRYKEKYLDLKERYDNLQNHSIDLRPIGMGIPVGFILNPQFGWKWKEVDGNLVVEKEQS
jgi:hypothetical protein